MLVKSITIRNSDRGLRSWKEWDKLLAKHMGVNRGAQANVAMQFALKYCFQETKYESTQGTQNLHRRRRGRGIGRNYGEHAGTVTGGASSHAKGSATVEDYRPQSDSPPARRGAT